MGRGAWQTTVHGVAKSQTRLKRLTTHFARTHTHTHTEKGLASYRLFSAWPKSIILGPTSCSFPWPPWPFVGVSVSTPPCLSSIYF